MSICGRCRAHLHGVSDHEPAKSTIFVVVLGPADGRVRAVRSIWSCAASRLERDRRCRPTSAGTRGFPVATARTLKLPTDAASNPDLLACNHARSGQPGPRRERAARALRRQRPRIATTPRRSSPTPTSSLRARSRSPRSSSAPLARADCRSSSPPEVLDLKFGSRSRKAPPAHSPACARDARQQTRARPPERASGRDSPAPRCHPTVVLHPGSRRPFGRIVGTFHSL